MKHSETCEENRNQLLKVAEICYDVANGLDPERGMGKIMNIMGITRRKHGEQLMRCSKAIVSVMQNPDKADVEFGAYDLYMGAINFLKKPEQEPSSEVQG